MIRILTIILIAAFLLSQLTDVDARVRGKRTGSKLRLHYSKAHSPKPSLPKPKVPNVHKVSSIHTPPNRLAETTGAVLATLGYAVLHPNPKINTKTAE
jgi:hypothetical protein